ncbi:MAG: homeobox domain-containing protein [Luteimonas sp.]|nr:homeobox domain-containing protein [Luteimonas sp.]
MDREARPRAQSTASTSADDYSCSDNDGQARPSTPPKPMRHRTIIQHAQLDVLEEAYAHERLPDARTRARLAKETGLPERVIRIWFQNRRAKDRRRNMAADGAAAVWGSPERVAVHYAPVYPPLPPPPPPSSSQYVHYADARSAHWQPPGWVPVAYYGARPLVVHAGAPWGVARYAPMPVPVPPGAFIGSPPPPGQPASAPTRYYAYQAESARSPDRPAGAD